MRAIKRKIVDYALEIIKGKIKEREAYLSKRSIKEKAIAKRKELTDKLDIDFCNLAVDEFGKI